MKQVFYFLLILFIFIIQSTFLNAISIAGVKPNIMLITVVAIGFLKGEYDALFCGLIAGILCDSFFSSYIGGNLFLYGIIGFLVGVICKEFYKENVVTPMIVCAAATLAFSFGNYVLIVLLKGFTNVGYYLFIRIIPEIVYNSLFMIVIYIIAFSINGKFERKIKYKRKVF